jgi:hypothetical protein
MRRSEPGGGLLIYRGTVCLGPRGPLAKRTVDTAAREEILQQLPPLAPRVISSAVVRGFAARVSVGVPTRRTWNMQILDQSVVLQSDATISWSWGLGQSTVTRGAEASHTWRLAGHANVSVSAKWTAHFSVDGMDPMPVEQTINQTGSLQVHISPARAVLIVPSMK